MARLAGMVVTCSVALGSTLGAPSTAAAGTQGRLLERIGHALAAVIKQDARKGGPGATTAVK
jgi:hypothetical protein